MFPFKTKFSKKQAAELLKVRPDALETFEKMYSIASMEEKKNSDNLFDINSRDATNTVRQNVTDEALSELTDKIVDEFFDENNTMLVSNDNLAQYPVEMRPQLTAHLAHVDIEEPAYIAALQMLKKYLDAPESKQGITAYHMFRQGLDILDVDPVLYEIIGMNRNSIGHWFPELKEAADKQSFFKVPETKIVKVPLTILQLTRNDYMSLTPATLDIVNKWAYRVFELDENKTYFIKTGTYSSKFDFRNAKVTSPQEVRELGSYLLFIHFQALMMASPLSKPCIYGVSTTNEWCVREFIEDKDNAPCIYHGMPLHTEYRVFLDCDTDEVLGIAPYWKPDVMKKRFSEGRDADTADMKHDYIIYSMYESTLMDKYEKNKDKVIENVKKILPDIRLTGQWSLDVMQNGEDFYLIDMATLETSALKDCVPKEKIRKVAENWLPEIPEA